MVELALLDARGAVLLDTLVRPSCAVAEGARSVHGITDAELAGAPAWAEVDAQLRQLTAGRLLVSHNAGFDARLVDQTSDAHGCAPLVAAEWACTMELLTGANGGRWPDLGLALSIVGAAPPEGAAHRARYDAECCRRIVLALAAAGTT